ncbi:GntR family transcriptional regulator [Tumidithrix helvetica PCC 7403]|uniref:GntR family transcriptional regulator n=1 Tax=Tumidithrix helvetica TaxID=3457545 RepID=UPI003CAB8C48
MVQFFIKADSEIPASTQLFDQISFAITTRQYTPGHQLPSTRQLANWTGLHRNTINKVYQQLKHAGLVEARGGSGIYVSLPTTKPTGDSGIPIPALKQSVRQSIDKIVSLGCSLSQVRDLLLAEIDWRLSCNAQLLVASGREDPGVAQVMAGELEMALAVPIQTVAVEDLDKILEHATAGTIVTNRYFLEPTCQAVGNHQVRVIAVDIYTYSREINLIRNLPVGSYVGLVSISTGILRLAESLIHSLRGDELLVVSALPQDTYRLQTIARSANLIITGHSGKAELKEAIAATKHDRIRPVEAIFCENYIASESIELLKLELGLN